jgi:hypothetical protein
MRMPTSLAVALTLVTSVPLAAAPPPATNPAARTEAAGGVEWKVPARWTAGSGSSMRVATYAVPAAKGAEAGECAVFFFGTGQGGSIDANVERWSKQFEGTPAAQRTTATVAGLKVTRAQLAGTYLAPGGPMMQSTGKRPGTRLVGAIVEAPEGNVFFKLTGPAATVAAAQAEFDALVASLRKK